MKSALATGRRGKKKKQKSWTSLRPIKPEIPGVDRALFARDALTGKAPVGGEVIIIGGGLVGCETAEYLTSLGKDEPRLAIDAVKEAFDCARTLGLCGPSF
jgi:hypothetical protein